MILTQDDDFFTELEAENTAGILFQRDKTLSTRDVGDAVHEMSQYIEQSDVTLEYVSRHWLYRTGGVREFSEDSATEIPSEWFVEPGETGSSA